MAIEMLFTKTFKKYKAEYRPDVVDYVREWAKEQKVKAFHEDNSIVKVTGGKRLIEGLLEELKEKFDYTPPEEEEVEKK